MFGSKSHTIAQLQNELKDTKAELEHLKVAMKTSMADSTDHINSLLRENESLSQELSKVKARLREIQDKSNARTRKCRAKKKAQN